MTTKAPPQPRDSVQSPQALLPCLSWELVDAGLESHTYMAWMGLPRAEQPPPGWPVEVSPGQAAGRARLGAVPGIAARCPGTKAVSANGIYRGAGMRRGTRRALAAPTAAASRGRAGARGRPACPHLPSGWGRPPGTHPRGSDSAGTGGRAGGGQQRQHHRPSVPTLADPARETPLPTPSRSVPEGTRTPP